MTDQMDAVLARLDRQAQAIRDLRERVAVLEESKSRASHPAGTDVTKGQAQPIPLPPTCLMCGEPKGVGHNGKTRETLMTCQRCADARRDGINAGGAAREAILVGECRLCGKERKRPTSLLLCGSCRVGVDLWKSAL